MSPHLLRVSTVYQLMRVQLHNTAKAKEILQLRELLPEVRVRAIAARAFDDAKATTSNPVAAIVSLIQQDITLMP